MHYITPVHTSTWLNIIQSSHHITCFRLPCRLSLLLTETGPYQSSLLLLASMQPCVWEQHPPVETTQYPQCSAGAPLALAGQQANVQCQDDMAICSHPSFPQRFPIILSMVWLRVSVTLPVMCVPVSVTQDILTLYQHNWKSCQVGPGITFYWCLWPDWSGALCAYWPSTGCTQGRHLNSSGCHVTSGTSRAEMKGWVSQIQLLRRHTSWHLQDPSHQWQYWFISTCVNPATFSLVFFSGVNTSFKKCHFFLL